MYTSSLMCGKRGLCSGVSLAAALALTFLVCSPALAQKGKKGGGGGGDSEGGETFTNPAFVFASSQDDGLRLLTYDGSQQVSLTNPPRGQQDRYAEWSPDGSMIAFRRKGDGVADLYVVTVPQDANGVVDVAAAQETRLLRDDLSYNATGAPAWAITNELITWAYLDLVVTDIANPSQRFLMGLSWDDQLRQLTPPDGFTAGDEIRLGSFSSVAVQPVATDNILTIAFVAGWTVFDQGALQYGGGDVFFVDADISSGRLEADVSTIRNVSNPNYVQRPADGPSISRYLDWSHDGRQLAFMEDYKTFDEPGYGGGGSIIAYDVATKSFTPLIVGNSYDNSSAPNQRPSWSPDGLEMALTIDTEVRGGVTYDVFVAPAVISNLDLRDPLIMNVTNTLKANQDETDPRWRPTWTRD